MSNNPYFYPGTDTLINKPGILDPVKLHKFERSAVSLRLAEFGLKQMNEPYSLEYLQKIHRYLFQDVYPFAGQIRTVDIGKDDFVFLNKDLIKDRSKEIFDLLDERNGFKGLGVSEYAAKSAKFMSVLNIIHPFREGNGRTIREFMRRLSLDAGYQLDLESQNTIELHEATVKAVRDPSDLEKIIKSMIRPDPPFPRGRILNQDLEI